MAAALKSLSELVATLERATVEFVSRQANHPNPALVAGLQAGPEYIVPGIANVDMPPGAKILMIEAPGAVGKSAAARFLAENRGWILVDSSRLQVGNYGLTGLLHDALGDESGVFEALRKGNVGIVVDAIDEAHLRAGTNNLFAFLEDLNNVASTRDRTGICMVLMTRPDAAEFVRVKFEDLGVPLASASIDFFGPDAARAFIGAHLSERATEPSREFYRNRNQAGFVELREARFDSIAEILLGRPITNLSREWGAVASFLGYAPVLAVVAETLAVANPFKDAQDEGKIAATAGDILGQLIRALLAREQSKFADSVGPRLESKVPATQAFDRRVLYSPNDQLWRLAAELSGISVEARRPPVVPEFLQADYEAAADQWVKDHPFLGSVGAVNTVFNDYVFAHIHCDPAAEARMSTGRNFEPGPFYFRFMHELAPTGIDDPLIGEPFLAPVIRSALRSSALKTMVWHYSQSEDAASLDVRDSITGAVLQYEIGGLSGLLEFESFLERGYLDTDSAVSLGGSDGRFELGPNMLIATPELMIDARELLVGPRLCVVHCPTIDAGRVTNVSVLSSTEFVVVGDDSWPLLRPFCVEDQSTWIASACYMDLRALLRGFRRQAAGTLSIYADKLDQGIVKKQLATGALSWSPAGGWCDFEGWRPLRIEYRFTCQLRRESAESPRGRTRPCCARDTRAAKR